MSAGMTQTIPGKQEAGEVSRWLSAPAPPKQGIVDPLKVKLSKDLAKVTEALPPAVLTMERKPDQVRLVIRQTNLKSVSVRVVNRFVEASIEKLLNPGADGAGGAEAVPVPPPKN